MHFVNPSRVSRIICYIQELRSTTNPVQLLSFPICFTNTYTFTHTYFSDTGFAPIVDAVPDPTALLWILCPVPISK